MIDSPLPRNEPIGITTLQKQPPQQRPQPQPQPLDFALGQFLPHINSSPSFIHTKRSALRPHRHLPTYFASPYSLTFVASFSDFFTFRYGR
jgi:hypothetical protein